MSKNLVQVDISKIDEEIANFQKEIDFRISLKKYAQSVSVVTSKAISIKKNRVGNDSVTGFVMNYLIDKKQKSVREIIQSYAQQNGKEYKEVQNNISNTLSRLKKQGKIDSKKDPEIGGVWFKI